MITIKCNLVQLNPGDTMNDVIKFLDELNDEELFEFEKDLKSGTIQKFIEQKKEYFKVRDKSCSVCGNSVNEDCLVLMYGDPRLGIRRKAHFCGTDCMEYFVNKNIRKNETGKKNNIKSPKAKTKSENNIIKRARKD
jgi:hypothetical protein